MEHLQEKTTGRGDAGQDGGENSGPEKPDRVDAINQLFAEFELAYHNQYYKAYGDPEKLGLAKKYWLGCLSRYSPLQIVRAARKVVLSQDFLPTISSVVRACDEGLSLFGLPEPRQAYIEACRAPSPKSEYEWSHEAVYYAARASDWYLLATEPETKAFPVFSHHYEVMCRRVMSGEPLEPPGAAALTESISRPLSPEENKARMKRLRKSLGI